MGFDEPQKAKIDPHEKAKFAYLENQGCVLVLIIGGICGTAVTIMNQAFAYKDGLAGAAAVAALCALGIGVTYWMMRVNK